MSDTLRAGEILLENLILDLEMKRELCFVIYSYEHSKRQ